MYITNTGLYWMLFFCILFLDCLIKRSPFLKSRLERWWNINIRCKPFHNSESTAVVCTHAFAQVQSSVIVLVFRLYFYPCIWAQNFRAATGATPPQWNISQENRGQWRFHAGAGGGHRPPKSWLGPKFSRPPKLWLAPKFSRTLDTVWWILRKKLVNLMPPDVRF